MFHLLYQTSKSRSFNSSSLSTILFFPPPPPPFVFLSSWYICSSATHSIYRFFTLKIWQHRFFPKNWVKIQIFLRNPEGVSVYFLYVIVYRFLTWNTDFRGHLYRFGLRLQWQVCIWHQVVVTVDSAIFVLYMYLHSCFKPKITCIWNSSICMYKGKHTPILIDSKYQVKQEL